MSESCCGGCKFWEPASDGEYGFCFRFPPVLSDRALEEAIAEEEDEAEGSSVWRAVYGPSPWVTPCVHETHWCGEFQQKQEATDDR